MAEPVNFGQLLHRWLRRSGMVEQFNRHKVLYAWPEIVGEAAAAHTEATGWRGKTLVVTVDHPIWAQQLTMMRHDLARRLNASAGMHLVEDIRFMVGRIGEAGQAGIRGPEGAGEEKEDDARPKELPPWVDRHGTSAPAPGAGNSCSKGYGPGGSRGAGEEDDGVALRLQMNRIVRRALARRRMIYCAACEAPVEKATPGQMEIPGSSGGADGYLCPVCSHSSRWGIIAELEQVLSAEPWLDYRSASRRIPLLEARIYTYVREKLKAEWKSRLIGYMSEGVPGRRVNIIAGLQEDALNYVMLETGCMPADLNDEKIRKLLGDDILKLFGRP